LVQALPAESSTEVTDVVVPACTAIAATSAWPAPEAIGTLSDGAAVGAPPVACRTSASGPGGGGGGGDPPNV
jgi:hypothetical protein